MQVTQLSMTTGQVRKLGFHFALGFLECLGVCLVVGYLLGLLLVPADDCDRSRFDRCGLRIATDAKTGRQYLLAPGGGIVERATP